jgi:putative glycosyltransferase (TIGR04348 family)
VCDRLTAFIATPAPAGSTTGNRVTALRWAKRLRELGWRVVIGVEWAGEPCELLVALHARKSHASVVRHAQQQPHAARVVALTGTDVYGDLDQPDASASIALAHRLIVLQPLALRRLPEEARVKARVIRQSATIVHADAVGIEQGLRACVLAHLRDVKDPFLAAHALALLPVTSSVHVLHLGGADEGWQRVATATQHALRGRWTWLGARSRREALSVLAASSLLVLTSRSEGGANVITEAIAAGVPVISTRIDGSIGILGDDYPGYYPVGDASALAALLRRCEEEPGFLAELRARVLALQPLVDPARERTSWRELVQELGISPTPDVRR